MKSMSQVISIAECPETLDEARQLLRELSADNLRLRSALEPLARIAIEYRKDGLDECRPSWGDGELADSQKELFSGRGGKQLLTLEHALRAHAVLTRS